MLPSPPQQQRAIFCSSTQSIFQTIITFDHDHIIGIGNRPDISEAIHLHMIGHALFSRYLTIEMNNE